ncbi:hypothetical protein FHP25_24905 [Vineibacter terrae]|uniref:Uncharacterized protein n=1 Tax=Vineibacter terrae TaxID=2586908 RepID=A0A5C8PFF9_9HYPH|nr:hypothetical protein [Vineibacter terrae]TXL72538.1 hypothetical protein FHP25_24905 [Vineibacter terrae]
MTCEPYTVRVRHGLEFTDGRPIGVVYLVDRRDPLVEITHALPVCEAHVLASALCFASAIGMDPVRAQVRDRDGHVIEVTMPEAAVAPAVLTIYRHADAASILAAGSHREASA